MKNKKIAALAAAVLVLAAAVLTVVIGNRYLRSRESEDATGETVLGTEATFDRHITYNGKTYTFNPNLTTCLFLGVDTTGEVNVEEHPGAAGQADSIILFIMDTETEETTMLQISRNAMVDVDVYGFDGRKIYAAKAQLALQYGYGDGKTRSSWLMKQRVSELLDGIPIDSSLAMNIDGISAATDLIGGVTLTIPEDYTSIDPSFKKGATVTLKGEQAEKYVRYRDITETGSNEGRMERQTQFIQALFGQMKKEGGRSTSFYQTVLDALDDHITTDLSAEDLKNLSEYELTDTETLPGEVAEGDRHDEFYVDEDALEQLIVELFYLPDQRGEE